MGGIAWTETRFVLAVQPRPTRPILEVSAVHEGKFGGHRRSAIRATSGHLETQAGRQINDLESIAEDVGYRCGISVIIVDWVDLSLVEQIRLIGSSTVHITPAGGGSYIGAYLPRGATTIRLYREDSRLDWHIFHYLGYVHVKHVNCPDGDCPRDDIIEMVGEAMTRYDEFGAAQ